MARRAGTWPKRQARALHRAWLRTSGWRAAVVLAACAGGAAGFWAWFPRPLNEFFAGALAASGLWIVALAASQVTGAGSVSMGAEAERWTSTELRKLCRRRWWVVGPRLRHCIDHVLLADQDIDHVLVGPEGVLAIETKWSASSWSDDIRMERAIDAASSARAKARKLGLILSSVDYGMRVEVLPLVVLWPVATEPVPQDPGGTPMVWGTELATRLPTWTALGPDEVMKAHRAVARWTALRDDYRLRSSGHGPWRRRLHRLRFNPARG